ncbi:MAG: M23 family metallopeptidase, partial [Ferruginibacter sp.]
MNLFKVVVSLILSAFYIPIHAQFFTHPHYPQGYFEWPVRATIGLVANFGELRPNHYHMGLDCQTEQKQNLPVLAAADGYIAKVKIEPSGFGRAIYINHPNGLTTLYGHLNDFNPALEKYVKEQQYKLKSWKIFLDIPASIFPVHKGDFIAYSGNTGGSQGPHVHFEIRDTKTEKVLNPSLFGFPIIDHVPPVIQHLAVYNRNISTYEQHPKMYDIKKEDGVYMTTPELILCNTNKVSFAIATYDTYSGSTNKNGIFEAVLYDDEVPVSQFQINSIGYDETRYENAHIDYKLRSSGGPFVEHLSKLPGYINSIYTSSGTDGIIELRDNTKHAIKIIVKDADGNASTLNFTIQRSALSEESIAVSKQKDFLPGYVNVFENNNISFYLPENALYDSIRFQFSELQTATEFPIYQLHNTSVPVHVYFPVSIKAISLLPNKMVMHHFANGKDVYAKAAFEKGWYTASFREFGHFQLMIDTIPPTINPVGFKNGMNCSKLNHLAFVISDNTEEIK